MRSGATEAMGAMVFGKQRTAVDCVEARTRGCRSADSFTMMPLVPGLPLRYVAASASAPVKPSVLCLENRYSVSWRDMPAGSCGLPGENIDIIFFNWF